MNKLLQGKDIVNREEMAGICKTWKEPEASHSVLELPAERIVLYKYVIDANNFS